MINSVERSSCYVLILAKDPLFLFHGDNSVGLKMNVETNTCIKIIHYLSLKCERSLEPHNQLK